MRFGAAVKHMFSLIWIGSCYSGSGSGIMLPETEDWI